MSERACIQKIADSVEDVPENVRCEVATDVECCLRGRSCEESVQSLAAWYGSLWARCPMAVVAFVRSVSASDLDQSFHVLMVLKVLTDSSAEQLRSVEQLQKSKLLLKKNGGRKLQIGRLLCCRKLRRKSVRPR